MNNIFDTDKRKEEESKEKSFGAKTVVNEAQDALIEKLTDGKLAPLEIRPILKSNPWHGKIGQESMTRPKGFHPLVDNETQRYSVALSDEKLKEYGDILNVDLHRNHTPGQPHPYWDSNRARIKLENNTMFFERNSIPGKIKVAILKASKYVANSEEQLEEGLYPDATHYIVNEEETGKVKAAKYNLIEEAIIKASTLSFDKKISLIMIINGKDFSKKTPETVKAEVAEMIMEDANTVLRFMSVDPLRLATEAMVEKAIFYSKLTKLKNGAIFYGDERLGFNVDEAVDFLIEDENQELRLRIRDLVS